VKREKKKAPKKRERKEIHTTGKSHHKEPLHRQSLGPRGKKKKIAPPTLKRGDHHKGKKRKRAG